MRKAPLVPVLALLAVSIPLHAQVSRSVPANSSARIVRLKKHMMPADFIGGVINDEIPQPQKYVYDVGVRFDCTLFVGRYESGTNETASTYHLNEMVNVGMTDGLMTLSSPQGRVVTTVVVSDERASGCPANE